jgi:hypothetical protein
MYRKDSIGQSGYGQSGMLPADSVAEGNVLACKTKVLHQSIVVEVPEQQMSRESGKFVDAGEVHLIREELLPKEWEFDPLAVKWLLEVPPPQLEDGLSDVDRLTRTIQKQWGKEKVVYSIRVLRHVAEALRANDGQVTATLIREPDHLHVIRWNRGIQRLACWESRWTSERQPWRYN